MKKVFLRPLLLFCLFTGTINGGAQNTEKPTFHLFSYEDGAMIQNMSDNGKWAVADAKSPEDDSKRAYPKLIDLSTNTTTDLFNKEDASVINWFQTMDVTDDGSIVVGSQGGRPAIYMASKKAWAGLPTPANWSNGCVNSITPDGKYAVGTATGNTALNDSYAEHPAMWDIAGGGVLVDLPNLPEKGMTGTNNNQSRLKKISADGRYILGCNSFSYLQPVDIFYYIYDRETQDWNPIGFTVDKANWKWTPEEEGLLFIDDAFMDNKGNYVTGIAYMVQDGSEFRLPFKYEIATKKFELYNETYTRDYAGYTISNNGTVLAASPAGNAIREWSIRQNGYWYDFSQILSQHYGMDYTKNTGYNTTGTPIAISDDGLTIAVQADPLLYKNYVVDVPEALETSTEKINLLKNYTVTPTNGSTFSLIKSIRISFDKDVQIIGSLSDISFKSDKGSTPKILKFAMATGSTKDVEITFRSSLLNAGEIYKLLIPAGCISLKDDQSKTNDAIEVSYLGRENTPVSVTAVSPNRNSKVSQINYSSNPVVFTFDCPVATTDTASAALYIDGREEPICSMAIGVSENKVAVYPTQGQYLYKGSNYKVVLNAGSVTDITGGNGNLADTVAYIGSYERTIEVNDTLIYQNNFDNGVGDMLLLDNDKLTPSSEMKDLGFEQENTPWMPIWDDDDSNNLCAGSNSSYSDVNGRADDWMSTSQLFIPDDNCVLTFNAQSYRAAKKDTLRVVVLEKDELINALTPEIVEEFKTKGKVVYCERETPGASEDKLKNDWTLRTVKLDEFAGKNVYIAFWNNNQAQSVVMVDDMKVVHNMNLLVAIDNEEQIVNAENIKIKGRILVKAGETVQNLTLTLKDADNQVVETIEKTDLNLEVGDVYNFEFANPLPLKVGYKNSYLISVTAGEEKTEFKSEISNLAFKPEKRVVIEEFTGMGCGNCPLGHLTLERLEKQYGNLVLPIAIHTYSGDPYANGLGAYETFLFGSSAGAPSANINRKGVYYPMASVTTTSGTDYVYNAPEGSDPLWSDVVAQEFNIETNADITISAKYDAKTQRLDIPCQVKFALNEKETNVYLFAVVMEDNLIGYQANYKANETSPALGEWGKGGIYGKAEVIPYYFDHVALGCIGTSFNGTGGYIPADVEAGKTYEATITTTNSAIKYNDANSCKVVVMMIDGNSGKYINAAQARLSITSGIEDAQDAQKIQISCQDNEICIAGAADAKVELIGMNGAVLNSAVCSERTRLTVPGYKGIVLVKVTEGSQTTVQKVLMK